MVKGFDHRIQWAILLGLGALLLALVLLACSRAEAFQGTELRPPKPTTPFELKDQFGQHVRLSDFEGQVVLLTFLYTNCPNVCPIVTSQLRDAYDMLSDDAGVKFIAISVDPLRDTVESAHAYSDKWDMLHNWSFLVGSEEELSPIWKGYFMDPVTSNHSDEDESDHTKTTPRSGVSALREDIAESYLVIHTTPVFLIDQKGVMRVVTTPPFETEDLVHDIRLLLD